MSDRGSICLKTGCLLRTREGDYWGDLHCLHAGTLVFNAVINDRGEPLHRNAAAYHYTPCTLTYDGPLFERRGVFVLLAHCASYNASLQAHFDAWGGPR